ncbi:hypothetical protein [Bosea rubneri]|uniref:Uncharacterized protein n=1 Tax=Bosea rubneri TaxID=3075434 RepID=A0ABU3S641_9HYPH|nr:hypothetical protein [Bosea sp. ZW T0_25]MDU0340250.1 hypothetical protein [Bosea sp. ZW T0_25]
MSAWPCPSYGTRPGFANATFSIRRLAQDTLPQSAAAPFQALAEQREHEAQIEQDRRETFVADIRFGLYG